jgi:hypothetical protein
VATALSGERRIRQAGEISAQFDDRDSADRIGGSSQCGSSRLAPLPSTSSTAMLPIANRSGHQTAVTRIGVNQARARARNSWLQSPTRRSLTVRNRRRPRFCSRTTGAISWAIPETATLARAANRFRAPAGASARRTTESPSDCSSPQVQSATRGLYWADRVPKALRRVPATCAH